jgi:crotonobetainyl-CoA:carnitine CoA-transferase CaiB-like acyl-CoA transferase
MAANRDKSSVTLDLKGKVGRGVLLDLAAACDVVVENYRPGVMDRLGLGFEDLQKVNPDIILCSISGYGQDGPLRHKISFDLVNQAMSGGVPPRSRSSGRNGAKRLEQMPSVADQHIRSNATSAGPYDGCRPR